MHTEARVYAVISSRSIYSARCLFIDFGGNLLAPSVGVRYKTACFRHISAPTLIQIRRKLLKFSDNPSSSLIWIQARPPEPTVHCIMHVILYKSHCFCLERLTN